MVTGVVPSAPRFLAFNFYRAFQAIPLLVDFFIECCQLTLSRFPKANLCTRKKSPRNVYEYALGGGLEPTKLTYTRLEDNLIRHRGDRVVTSNNWPSRDVRGCPAAVRLQKLRRPGTIEGLRYTSFWLNLYRDDGAP